MNLIKVATIEGFAGYGIQPSWNGTYQSQGAKITKKPVKPFMTAGMRQIPNIQRS